jgi:hypothetical protein
MFELNKKSLNNLTIIKALQALPVVPPGLEPGTT